MLRLLVVCSALFLTGLSGCADDLGGCPELQSRVDTCNAQDPNVQLELECPSDDVANCILENIAADCSNVLQLTLSCSL